MRRLNLIISALLIMAATLIGATSAVAQDTSAQQAKKARLEKEVEQLNRQIKGLASKKENALGVLELTKVKISKRQELITETEGLIRSLRDSIKTCEEEVERLARRRDTLSNHYARLIKSAYKNRDPKIWYMSIFSSRNLGEAVRRFSYLRRFSQNLNGQATKIAELTATLEEKQLRLSELKKEAETSRSELVAGMAALRVDEAESKRLLASLDQDRSRWERAIRDKNAQIERLNREIAEIIRRASASSGAASEADIKLSSDFASNKGILPWPARGPVVEPFGEYTHPVYQNVTMPFNNGITLSVADGTAVKAVFDGTVTRVAVIPGFNQCVLVRHGKYFTLYGKLKSVTVSKGDIVKTGQVLGTVETVQGETRFHFELWEGRNPQNPVQWLRR